MDPQAESPSEIAKQTLIRLTKERLQPTAENYCRTYRKLAGKSETWSAACDATRFLEEALADLSQPWTAPGSLVEPETARHARELIDLLKTAASDDDLKRIRDVGRTFGRRQKHDMADNAALQGALLQVLREVLTGLGSMAEDDQWLLRELEAAEALLSGSISTAKIVKARESLSDLIARQRESLKAMANAKLILKDVVAEVIRQAASLADDTAGYAERISTLGQRIQAAEDLHSIKDVVGELDGFVREMGRSVSRSHEGMSVAHARLVEAEREIIDLRQHLAETSEKARRDALTGALNRSGLDDIWRREVARATSDGTPLSIGILDVDNFKQINDNLGHSVGDEALVHLAAVIRKALHGTDTMARYGGEEFVIVLPDTDAAGAEALMRRLQRELTKHYFLHDNERLLITFSAGVTEVQLERDGLLSSIERADGALYEAKHLGKNRVAVA